MRPLPNRTSHADAAGSAGATGPARPHDENLRRSEGEHEPPSGHPPRTAPVHRPGDNLGTSGRSRRTSCAHPVGDGTRGKTSAKPLVRWGISGLELRTRRERRAGHPEETPAADGPGETRTDLLGPLRTLGHVENDRQVTDSAPRSRALGRRNRETGDRGRPAGRARRTPGDTAGAGGPLGADRPRGERETASRWPVRRVDGRYARRSAREGQPDRRTAGRAAGPSISYIEGPAPVSSMPGRRRSAPTTRRGVGHRSRGAPDRSTSPSRRSR